MLSQTGGDGVAVGVSPGAEAVSAALFVDGSLNLGQDLLKVAGLFGQIQAQSAGIAHQRRGQVSLDEVSAVLQQLLQQGLGVCIVGAEVSSLRAVLLNPLRNLLQDVSLSTGNADVRGGIGSGFQNELHAELFAGSLHDGNTAGHGLISHVAGEGDVHEGVTTQLVSGTDDQVATGNEVVVGGQVSSGTDLGQVLVGLTGDADDVGAALLDLAESFGGAGHSLVDHDGLHLGIIGQVHNGLNGGFQLFGEVVGVDCQGDILFAVHSLEGLSTAAVVLGLRNGTGHDTDVEGVAVCVQQGVAVISGRSLGGSGVSSGSCGGGSGGGGGVAAAAGYQGESHSQDQQNAHQLFHF